MWSPTGQQRDASVYQVSGFQPSLKFQDLSPVPSPPNFCVMVSGPLWTALMGSVCFLWSQIEKMKRCALG